MGFSVNTIFLFMTQLMGEKQPLLIDLTARGKEIAAYFSASERHGKRSCQ